jgi:hypothetical protein
MSLAMYAAPFDNEVNQVVSNDTTNHIGKKRMAMNKTQKRYQPANPKENVNTNKVLSVLQTIHNLPEHDNELADFSPMPPPQSMGVQATISRESLKNRNPAPSSENLTNETMDENDLNQSSTFNVYSEDNNQNMSEDYYKRFIPNYENMYKTKPYNVPNYKFSHTTTNGNPNMDAPVSSSNELLIEKLNYMIHLLEEQKDERTNNVTEEVVLYSFLGIFIIFIVDSFSRVGKYTR